MAITFVGETEIIYKYITFKNLERILKTSLRKYQLYKRIFDVFFALASLIIFGLPILVFGVIIKIVSGGPIIFWSERVGINNSRFLMAKLRTMKNSSPLLSSNHFKNPEKYFICFGKYLRDFGFDELPQLYNILKGDMSFVGPRPVLIDDHETLKLREHKKVHHIKPGLTGLAQISGRNALTFQKKVYYDEIYLQNMSILFDIKIILLTISYVFKDNIFDKKELPDKQIIHNIRLPRSNQLSLK